MKKLVNIDEAWLAQSNFGDLAKTIKGSKSGSTNTNAAQTKCAAVANVIGSAGMAGNTVTGIFGGREGLGGQLGRKG